MDFNHLELCAAGRIYLWVQDLRTYSPRYIWPAITSKSNFMGSSFSPQSELGRLLLGLAQGFPVATRCNGHCIKCAAQGIKGTCWPGVILSFLPRLYSQANKGKSKVYKVRKVKSRCKCIFFIDFRDFLLLTCLCACAQRRGQSRLTNITDNEGCVRWPT